MSIRIDGALDNGNGLQILQIREDGVITGTVDPKGRDLPPAPPSGGIQTIVAGTGIDVDATDPENPVISTTSTGAVETVTASETSGLAVDNTDPANPVVTFSDIQGTNPSGVSTATVRAGAGQRGSYDNVRLMTAANLSAFTAAGAGPGKTLTCNANEVLTVDGSSAVLDDRIGVKNHSGAAANSRHHGIYVVTDPGSISTPWILTRAGDFDTTAEIHQDYQVGVNEGTANSGLVFAVNVTYGDGAMDSATGVRPNFSEITNSGSFMDSNGVSIPATASFSQGATTFQPDTIPNGSIVQKLGDVITNAVQGSAIPDAAGGITIDAEARTALNAVLAFLRTRTDIAT